MADGLMTGASSEAEPAQTAQLGDIVAKGSWAGADASISCFGESSGLEGVLHCQ